MSKTQNRNTSILGLYCGDVDLARQQNVIQGNIWNTIFVYVKMIVLKQNQVGQEI